VVLIPFRTLRSQYFHDEGDGITFYEKAIRYGAKFQENENSSQVSLFEKMFKLLNRSYHVRTGALWKTGQRERGSRNIYIRTSIR
jgi:hypothetical protein